MALVSSWLAALSLAAGAPPALDARQSEAFRAWMVRIVAEQLRRGPSPRWTHRDCAGLVRFASREALRRHDASWRAANGLAGEAVPPEVDLQDEQAPLARGWRLPGGGLSSFVDAATLIQENARLVSRDINQARPGDLLYFDQGDDQHLMVWMGGYAAYHTGRATPADPGLRSVGLEGLMRRTDTRWNAQEENPNFAGIYRFSFLSF